MDNKQLLERAAKAAGYENFNYSDNHGDFCLGEPYNGEERWNPINFDADAFRLMVDCEIEVTLYITDVRTQHPEATPCDSVTERYADHNNDKHAATRMAVTKAAAQSQEKAS